MRDNNSTQNPKSTSEVQGQDTKNSSNFLSLEAAIQFQKREILTEQNIPQLVEKAQIDPFKMVEKPPGVIEYKGTPLATLGNFSVLNGKPKSRKSTFSTILSIVALDNNNYIYRGFKNLRPYSDIIYFDTESSEYHANKLGNRIVTKLKLKPDTSKFSLFGLREHSPEIRLKIIEEVLYNSKNLSLVVIDGIADLLTKGYNDESDAINITSKLLKWTKELNIHIITVVHQNKGDNYAKGHLGSFLNQKAETVLNIVKSDRDANISIVKAAFSRGIDIEDIYFSMDENGIPIITDAPVTAASNKPLKIPTDFDYEFKLSLVEEAFQSEKEILFKALSDKLKHYLADKGFKVGNTLLRDWITYYKETKIILQIAKNHPYTLNSKFIQKERIKFKFE